MTELVHVTRGVWRAPAAVADLAGRVEAILSVYPPGTVVGGLTAALLHGLWLPQVHSTRIELILRPDVSVPAARSASVRREVRGRRQILHADEVVTLGGIRLTSQARTWLDLATRLQLPDLVAAGDSVLRGDSDADELAMLVRRARHRPGVIRAREALPLLNGRSRSRPESHLRCAVLAAGLPSPAVNVPVFDSAGQWLFEPDLGFPEALFALEYNGADHAKTKRMRRDMTRTVDAVDRGRWYTLAVGPAEVFNRPEATGALVRRIYYERLPRPASQ